MLLKLFDRIAQSGICNIGVSLLIIAQVYVSIFYDIKFLFKSMKNKPKILVMSFSAIPMVFVLTYSIGCGIIFGTFLGNGIDIEDMEEIFSIAVSKTCITEMMFFVTVFFVLMIIYSLVHKLKPIQWIVTFGTELLAAFSLIILYGGLLVNHFPFTILDFCKGNIYLARNSIYGYFIILFKCVILFLSLFLGLLLRERKNKDEVEQYFGRSVYYEKKVLRYLVRDNLPFGISLLFVGTFEAVLLWGIAITDKTFIWDGLNIFYIVALTSPNLIIWWISWKTIYHTLRPKTMNAYSQLLAMGDKDTVFQLFCEEIIDNEEEEDKRKFNKRIKTKHFLLKKEGINIGIEWNGN